MRKLDKKSVAISAAVFTVVGSGAALAYWTQSGSGTGSAATGTTTAITVHQTSTVAGLYPGGPAQALSGTFDNPNAGTVYVAGVKVDSITTSNPDCKAADFVVTGTGEVKKEIASGTGVGSWGNLTVELTNTAADQDACKNATLTIAYSAF